MSTGNNFLEPPGLRVTVDRVLYHPLAATPAERPYCFIYFITIHNDTELAVTIKGRKWVVTNADGEVTVVEGEGIVGEFPLIESGEKFNYNSFHLLSTTFAFAEGSYLELVPAAGMQSSMEPRDFLAGS
jgi:ApaG protein